MLDRPDSQSKAAPLTPERALPARLYFDAAVLDAERENVFFKSWRYVCHLSRLGEPGDYVTTSLFDQEVIVVRTRDLGLKAFYNVCPHRAHRLVDGSGRKARFVCPYHAWTYDLDGRLLRARGAKADRALSDAEICLSEVRVDRLLDFVFINLDSGAETLAKTAPGLAESILGVVPDLADYAPRENAADYFGGAYDCNWKVALDNFLECYHCETAHASFSDIMDIPGTRYEISGGYSYQFVPSANKADNAAYPLDLEEDALDGHFWFLFPNTLFSVFPGVKNFAISRADPDGPERTVRRFDTLTPPAICTEREAARAKWGLEVVNEEDKALCENVQRGLRQRGFDRGYYLTAPDRDALSEEAVRFFHRLYAEKMGLELT